MKVLVTGGYGFIGSYVVNSFFDQGHEVFILDDLSMGNVSNVLCEHISMIEDVQSDNCEAFFIQHSFDMVIHLAAQTLVQHSLLHPVNDSRINVSGLVNMLHLSAKYKVKQFVFASSAAVYGNSNEPVISEQTICKPSSPYGMNKWIGEHYCHQWKSMFGLNSVCLRFSNVYGPRYVDKTEGSVIPLFINQLLNGKQLQVFGDGGQTRDFIFVEDISKAIYLAAVKGISGVYNLSTSVSHSINQVIEILENLEPGLEVAYLPERSGDIRHSLLDSIRIRRKLGWEPQYSLKEGIEETYRYLKERSPLIGTGAGTPALY